MLVNVTIPVFNEEAQLAQSIDKLEDFLATPRRFDYEIVVVNNGSTDRTLEVARELARAPSRVRLLDLPQKGRGGALKRAWWESCADVLSYMDVDLSTDLAAFPKLIAGVASGSFDLGIGSRLLPESQTTRCLKREFISRGYNWLVKLLMRSRLSDAQCGFKAVSRKAAQELLPLVEDSGWFFDTELLAERLGYRICELPVRWIEDPDSRVKLLRTALADLRGLLRLRRRLAKGRFTHPPSPHTRRA
jgi:glycosyltransferase involved in cell wall biosynthesis